VGSARRVRGYLFGAVDLVRRIALFSHTVDWPGVRQEAEDVLAGASCYADTHALIRSVLLRAGGRHSQLTVPGQSRVLSPQVLAAVGPPVPTGRVVDTVGYLRLPRLSGSVRRRREYVRTGGLLLAELAAARPTGWIVDLRANTGGSMWPMLAVAAPLLPEGELGYFLLPGGAQRSWSLADGRVRLAGRQMARSRGPRSVPDPGPLVVLTGNHTASAGEAVAVAFSARPEVRVIGLPTRGLTSGNETRVLRDGTRMHITGSFYADHRRRRITGSLGVDEEASGEAALAAAVSWVRGRQG
jgi:C-terminal processing protease CtpA/Prc